MIIKIIIAIMIFDFVCFCAWVLSGQQPLDNFYFGAITGNIIKLFL
jgi:hypothetical protein